MEIDITAFLSYYQDDMARFSNSRAESGLDNIGEITWRNARTAMAESEDWLTSDLDYLRSYFLDCGAWDTEELAAMSGQDLNALLVQFIASDCQAREQAEERGELEEWEENEGGRLMAPRDLSGQWFYYIGD